MWLYLVIALVVAALLFYPVTTAVMYRRAKDYHSAHGLHFEPMDLLQYLDFNRQLMLGIAKLGYWSLRFRHRHGAPLSSENDANPEAPIVLFVHGFHMNGSCFWGMRQFMEAQGWASYAINLGLPYTDPNQYAARLIQSIDVIAEQHPNRGLHLVGHSMGGLITRMALQAKPALAENLTSVITLGTPHQGTAVISRYALTWVKEMFHPNSRFISELPEFDQLAANTQVTTIASRQDLVVYPAEYAHTAKGENINLSGFSHMGLLTEAPIHRLVLETLTASQTR